ncbi:hypothetical protein BOTBODRAFT_30215 [Botryobasidium botryosum FD-172 SS1]|uniref:CCD97-like C-terminal domain-containing protein n=1 Tax=Botryobasidium botryosum (strain FD-172 SS1) TaxID=930990 RepID=A0A067MPF1_BOTB1|nr:hypothetical protein BOTBODRAFT_30215 [Botryobasidium botryosum FD-172 SS1]
MESPRPDFDPSKALRYLGLAADYTPSPSERPLDFLALHLSQLPPQILTDFSTVLSPRKRSKLPGIRNRRLKYALTQPAELSWVEGRTKEPLLWEGGERKGEESANAEKSWAETEFMGGVKGSVGKIGTLLAEYEEEREAEAFRTSRREKAAAAAETEEEVETDSDEEDEEELLPEEPESPEEVRATFERLLRERFIAGLLQDIDYDKVDYDDQWDPDDRDDEDRWFDEEEES